MASQGSIATTLSPTRSTISNSQLLTSSISSLSSSSSRQASSQISKIYRQASTLFLTRRLPESLSTILPVITPPASEDTDATLDYTTPILRASRTTRIKVWSLYLTILNAIIELDPDEGKHAFGSSEWRNLVTKVREGEVWEEVVKNGYGGVEGNVDSDVVINLATLLLAHARSQKINQTRLENYLASSSRPTFDISDQLSASQTRRRAASPSKSGADTPRDLNARVKILELYTLHVLLRNNEWDYAREFISISSVLDDERREAFLQALQSLRDEQYEVEAREKEEKRYQEEQLKKDIEEAKKRREENDERERKREEDDREKRRETMGSRSSEVDYGVEDTRPGSSSKSRSAKGGSSLKPAKSPTRSPTSRASAPAARKAPAGVIARAGNIFANIRKLVESMAGDLSTRPMFLMQMLAFIVGLLMIVSRRDVKERVKRLLAQGWGKVRQTAGMGVKVSYI